MADENWMEDMLEVDAPRAVNVVDFPRANDPLIDAGDYRIFGNLALGGHDGKQALGNVYNAGLIMSRDQRLAGIVGYDEFRERVCVLKDIDTGVDCVPFVRVDEKGESLQGHHINALMAFMQAPCEVRGYSGGHGCGVTKQAIEAGISNAARQNPFDPVKMMIEAEEWDGVPRLDTWLHRYFDCTDDAYHSEVGRKWMVGAVARVYEPGTKFDFVLTLLGAQGGMKSTIFEIIGGGDFYSSMQAGAMKDGKTLIEATAGKWIVEVAEMAAMKGESQENIKNIITTKADTARLSYDKDATDRKRRFVFAATTNRVDMLDDPTGGRRYWIVETPKGEYNTVDDASFEAEIPQLRAEALHIYREMRKAKPTGNLPLSLSEEAGAIAKAKQSGAVAYDDIDALADEIRGFFEKPRDDGDAEAYGYRYYSIVAPKEIFAGITGRPIEEYAAGKVARDIVKACRRIDYLRVTGERTHIRRIKEKAKPVIVDAEKFLPHFAARLRDVEGANIPVEVRAGAGEREEKMAGRGGSDIVDGILDL